MIRGSTLSPGGRHCRQGCLDVYKAVQMSTGPFRCLQGRPDVDRTVQMSSGLDNLSGLSQPSRSRQGRVNVKNREDGVPEMEVASLGWTWRP